MSYELWVMSYELWVMKTINLEFTLKLTSPQRGQYTSIGLSDINWELRIKIYELKNKSLGSKPIPQCFLETEILNCLEDPSI